MRHNLFSNFLLGHSCVTETCHFGLVCLEKPVLQTALSVLNNLCGDPIDSVMLFSHCFLKCFLFSGGIFLEVRFPLLELFIQPYAAHEGMTILYIYKPQGRDSKPNKYSGKIAKIT